MDSLVVRSITKKYLKHRHVALFFLIFRTIGDLVFDIVKEVIAETVGGLVTRSLGLSTGRRSGGEDFSLVGTVMRAVAKVANGDTC